MRVPAARAARRWLVWWERCSEVMAEFSQSGCHSVEVIGHASSVRSSRTTVMFGPRRSDRCVGYFDDRNVAPIPRSARPGVALGRMSLGHRSVRGDRRTRTDERRSRPVADRSVRSRVSGLRMVADPATPPARDRLALPRRGCERGDRRAGRCLRGGVTREELARYGGRVVGVLVDVAAALDAARDRFRRLPGWSHPAPMASVDGVAARRSLRCVDARLVRPSRRDRRDARSPRGDLPRSRQSRRYPGARRDRRARRQRAARPQLFGLPPPDRRHRHRLGAQR